jgi:MFS transporter, DHA3 family, tetracycline resistance protein
MFSINPRKMEARRMYLFMSAAASIAFTMGFAVSMVYQIQTIGMSPLQLVLAGTVLEVTIFLFEVPTGVVADIYSRRLSITIGYFLIGLGFVLQGAIPSFATVLAFSVLWGVGHTFTSGATEAWITDEVGEDQVGALFMRATQINNLVGIPTTVIAIVLGSLLITLPIVLGGIIFLVITLMMVLYMPETGFHPNPPDERGNWGQMRDTLTAGAKMVRARPTLLAILGIGLFFGLYSEGYDRLGDAHLLKSFALPDFGPLQPVAWMGLIGIIGGLLAILAARVMEKRLDMTRSRSLGRASFALSGLMIASLIAFALVGNFYMAVIINWVFGIGRTLIGPIQTTWINQHIDSNVRATVISMSGQVDAFGQIAGGPPAGFIGERFGVRAALLASGFILSPVLALYMRFLRREKQENAVIVTVD